MVIVWIGQAIAGKSAAWEIGKSLRATRACRGTVAPPSALSYACLTTE